MKNGTIIILDWMRLSKKYGIDDNDDDNDDDDKNNDDDNVKR